MTLYLEPPSGNISLQKLETFAVKRLQLLMKVHTARGDVCLLQQIMCEEEVVTNSDCLIAGSMKDKVSHFILRLLVGGDPEMSSFFVRSETVLFDFHFSCMSENEMLQFFHRIDKQLQKQNLVDCILEHPKNFSYMEVRNILAVFSSIKSSAALSWRDIIKLYLVQSPRKTCSLPFQCVLSLMQKRHVHLQQGMAQVPLCKLREVVSEQFCCLMKIAVSQARLQLPSAVTDCRMKILWRKLKIQLTLFLKEMGLPVHHALALWQQEYSQPPGPDSRCSHSWQKDGPRYTYSVRHLYGLEGARQNYHGHCCQSLQQTTLGCSEEGGCPFAHWDDENLTAALLSCGQHTCDVSEILRLRRLGQFSSACQMTLRTCGSSERGCRGCTGARRVKRNCETVINRKVCTSSKPSHSTALSNPSTEESSDVNLVRTESVLCEIHNRGNRNACAKISDKSIIKKECSKEGSFFKKVPSEMSAHALSSVSTSCSNHVVRTVELESGHCGVSKSEPPTKVEQCVQAASVHCSKVSGVQTLAHTSVFSHTSETACENLCETEIQQSKRRKLSHCISTTHRQSLEPKGFQRLPVCSANQAVHNSHSSSETSSACDNSNTFCSAADTDQSCFDHELCPSQMSKRSKRFEQLESVQHRILKPVDYFHLSYKMMLDGLR